MKTCIYNPIIISAIIFSNILPMQTIARVRTKDYFIDLILKKKILSM